VSVTSQEHTHNTAPTQYVDAGGTRFAYRRFGNPAGVPLVFFQHFRGNLDNYDPAITDALALSREVVLFDNTGVGRSTGSAPDSIEGMARDAASFIDALGLETIDMLGHSMGGEVSQQLLVTRRWWSTGTPTSSSKP
jgi:pimeloyl-ACP methyl ester carboxylesterase